MPEIEGLDRCRLTPSTQKALGGVGLRFFFSFCVKVSVNRSGLGIIVSEHSGTESLLLTAAVQYVAAPLGKWPVE